MSWLTRGLGSLCWRISEVIQRAGLGLPCFPLCYHADCDVCPGRASRRSVTLADAHGWRGQRSGRQRFRLLKRPDEQSHRLLHGLQLQFCRTIGPFYAACHVHMENWATESHTIASIFDMCVLPLLDLAIVRIYYEEGGDSWKWVPKEDNPSHDAVVEYCGVCNRICYLLAPPLPYSQLLLGLNLLFRPALDPSNSPKLLGSRSRHGFRFHTELPLWHHCLLDVVSASFEGRVASHFPVWHPVARLLLALRSPIPPPLAPLHPLHQLLNRPRNSHPFVLAFHREPPRTTQICPLAAIILLFAPASIKINNALYCAILGQCVPILPRVQREKASRGVSRQLGRVKLDSYDLRQRHISRCRDGCRRRSLLTQRASTPRNKGRSQGRPPPCRWRRLRHLPWQVGHGPVQRQRDPPEGKGLLRDAVHAQVSSLMLDTLDSQ